MTSQPVKIRRVGPTIIMPDALSVALARRSRSELALRRSQQNLLGALGPTIRRVMLVLCATSETRGVSSPDIHRAIAKELREVGREQAAANVTYDDVNGGLTALRQAGLVSVIQNPCIGGSFNGMSWWLTAKGRHRLSLTR